MRWTLAGGGVASGGSEYGADMGLAAAVCRHELTVSSAMVWWWTWTRVVLAVHVAVGALGVVLGGEGEVTHVCTYQC